MDWKDKKFNYSSALKKFDWKKRFLTKSRSNTSIIDTCSQFCCNSKSFNFSESFKRLGLEKEDVYEEDEKTEILNLKKKLFIPRSQESIELCMCKDCLEQESKISGIKTREISSFRLVVQGPEILHYQGVKYSPEDVAPYWKKDSRMWLWKSVRYAQRQKKKSKSFPRFPVFSRTCKNQ
ncbi:uncharacterized protein [Chelonus insularis]|uniref:uncharacterized protein n=1 Tax=Chelonus insularis TaxID=460826 RepID=UPI00158EBD17|nr:uncharacterized protein LOC118069379 [Chelonus insularis]